VRNVRFNRDDGCAMHGPTGMMGAECTILPGMMGAMYGSTGMMGVHCTVIPV